MVPFILELQTKTYFENLKAYVWFRKLPKNNYFFSYKIYFKKIKIN